MKKVNDKASGREIAVIFLYIYFKKKGVNDYDRER